MVDGQVQQVSNFSKRPLSWADASDRDDCLPLSVRTVGLDDEKMFMVGALLGISSPSRSIQLKEILKDFWEAVRRD